MRGERIFIAGNGTGVGKTVVSAIVASALCGEYWKPVQAGELEKSDLHRISELTEGGVPVHLEAYRLTEPMSPHAAAEIDGVRIDGEALLPPQTVSPLIIEAVGGVLVPLNENQRVVDLIGQFKALTIVVCQNYLGSINHSLLTLEALERRGLPVLGVIFNGPPVKSSEEIILHYSGMTCLGRVDEEVSINSSIVLRYANLLREPLLQALSAYSSSREVASNG